jgi:hypothetical protein
MLGGADRAHDVGVLEDIAIARQLEQRVVADQWPDHRSGRLRNHGPGSRPALLEAADHEHIGLRFADRRDDLVGSAPLQGV